jgi:4-amino-4-deoxy-L-arabinose transferase-like glycosyltransferase
VTQPPSGTSESAPGGPRRELALGVALFAVAFAPRLYAAIACGHEPVWDGHYYDFGARRIAAGLGYSDDLSIDGRLVWHPWCHYPVGYSAFLALFYRVFGPGTGVAAFADALTGAALAVVTWRLARYALSERRAIAAGLLVALHPGLVLYAALEMTEPLAALLTLAAFWVAVRDPRPRRGLALGALVLGVAALVRPQALLCAPFLAIVLPAREGISKHERARGLVLGGALALALSLLPVLPWTVRNCRVMDGCALISTNGGWNLAIGAFPRATGRFETLRSSDGCRDVTGQVQQDRCWFSYGLREIELHPGHWLGLVPAKLGFTFDHESCAGEYLHEAAPQVWPEPVRTAARGATTLAERGLVCAAALGVVAIGRRGRGARLQGALALVWLALVYVACAGEPTFWPLVLFTCVVPWLPVPGRAEFRPALLLPVALLATTALTHAVFFGEDRYHVVVVPVLAMLAAAALRPSSPSSALTDSLATSASARRARADHPPRGPARASP